jgi:hypothetical protein
MASFNIQIRNIREIQRVFRTLPENLKKEGQKLIADEFTIAAEEAKALAKTTDFTGKLSNGISAQVEAGGFVYKSSAPYSAYHEFGTRSQVKNIPRGFEPFAARFKSSGGGSAINGEYFWDRLVMWLEYRNIPVEKWFNIYAKIKKEGRQKGVNGQGFYLGPYIKARRRIADGLRGLLAKAIR